jgi:two-component system OmpR family sensor kinase/two-component system sensor histidine kinase QseC
LRAWTYPEAHGVLPMLVLASFGIVLVPALWLLRRLLRPLREMAGALRQRTPSNLEPLQLDHAPAELVPVLSAINRLFGRVSEAMRREAGFTALAAHELRTPLATLRLLAESANQASNDEERGQALAELIRSADRCSHLQEQLLTLSRLETIKAADMVGQVDMTEVVMNALVDQVAPARRRHIKLASRLDGSAICGHPFGVQTLLRNLICNAVNYTPAGGRVEISTVTEGNDVIVHVDDSGPGVPADQRERVFGRFERLQREQTSGVGLGLSIVRTVAQAHEATVSLHDSPLGGLRVAVNFVGRAIQVPLEPEMEVEETVEPEPHGGSLATAGNPAD